ncbi:MAG: dihydrofolate reductase [Candidatus Eremiobacterota bacterium]
MTRIVLVAALGRNRSIGRDGQVPWRLPADLRHFRSVTMGKPVVMGRKTFESIGKPLPGRHNLILTRDPNYTAEGCRVMHGVAEVVAACADAEELCVIGGEQIYREFLPMATRQILTLVDAAPEADAFYPEFPAEEWQEVLREPHPADEANPLAFEFVTLSRAEVPVPQ